MKCLAGTTMWYGHTQGQGENVPGTWSFQEVRNTRASLKQSLNSQRQLTFITIFLVTISVGFFGATSIPFHYFLQRVPSDISLCLPRYLKKYCVTKNYSYSGACTMHCSRKDKYGGFPNSCLENWVGRLRWWGNVAWMMMKRINNPRRRLTSRITLI